MTKATKTTTKTKTNLPPRHSGYRAAATGRFTSARESGRISPPKAPSGDAGGSRPKKLS